MSARKGSTEANPFPIERVLSKVEKAVQAFRLPIVTEQSLRRRDPFRVLVSTVISLRTKDDVTEKASERLFALADSPKGLLELGENRIADAIYPAGFYHTKAKNLIEISRQLLETFNGRVPEELEDLLALPGVGRKTANLVRTLGFGLPGICVDTHVHRITNRWGYVITRNPEETEMALRERLPGKYWIPINDWLVAYGQNLCVPISPHCSRCPVFEDCARVGVTKHR